MRVTPVSSKTHPRTKSPKMYETQKNTTNTHRTHIMFRALCKARKHMYGKTHTRFHIPSAKYTYAFTNWGVWRSKHTRVLGSKHVIKQKHMRVMAFFLCFYENTGALTVYRPQTLNKTTCYPKLSVITSQGGHRPGSQ